MHVAAVAAASLELNAAAYWSRSALIAVVSAATSRLGSGGGAVWHPANINIEVSANAQTNTIRDFMLPPVNVGHEFRARVAHSGSLAMGDSASNPR